LQTKKKMDVQNVDTGESSIGTELMAAPIDDVLLLMPEEETLKSKNNSTTNVALDSTKKQAQEETTVDTKEYSNEIMCDKPNNHVNNHQFQISIHAGHEEDLELNFDSFNESSNTQTNNNNNNNDASKTSHTSNNNNSTNNTNDQLNLNSSNVSNENPTDEVKLEVVNTSSSNGSINEGGEHLRTKESTKEKEDEETLKNGATKEKNKDSSRLGIEENVINDIKYIFKNTRYFLMKSNNYENIDLAKAKV